jgi:hypothetical protein
MNKPPPSTPHSDIDGVHEDRHHVIGAANREGNSAGSLDDAAKQKAGRPRRSPAPKSKTKA